MKKFAASVLTVLLLINMAGCRLLKTNDSGTDEDNNSQPSVLLSPGDASDDISGDEEIKEPVFSEQIQLYTAVHEQILPDEYYQKSFLSDTEKKVYDLMADAALKGFTNINVTQYDCAPDSLTRIYYALQADYPQLFYLSGYFSYTTSSSDGAVKDIYLIYFDGKTTDRYSNTLKPEKQADRDLIKTQIKAFNKKVNEIVNMIPTGVSDYEKEKWIYEYLQDYITFDKEAGDSTPSSYDEMNTHSFDSYGAACEAKAVCEGYAELFQYLCYCSGIQATIVRGRTTRENHMWNAVCLDSEWYMVDPTWDDYDRDGMHCYSYFNVTTEYIKNAEHIIEADGLNVPLCTATKYAYYNTYALFIKSTSESPENYKDVIDYVVSKGEKYMCVYVGNHSDDLENYFQQFVYSPDSDMQKYISEQRYKIKISTSYYNVDDTYHYIEIEKG